MNGVVKNSLLVAVVVLLAVVPLITLQHAGFEGADGQAEEAISAIDPDYEPWFSPFWEPPGGEIESLLFVLQAAGGAGVIGFGLGLLKGRQQNGNPQKA